MLKYQSERESVCEYGRLLCKKNLVARTWGNLSVRSGQVMLITPSGLAYENLTPSDIVPVSIDDLSYEGKVKPSSEKELHAVLYRLLPNAGAVFHTHQLYASALAASRKSFAVFDENLKKTLGGAVHCASYALPTTSALAKAAGRKIKIYFAERLNKAGEKCSACVCGALLLANHGAVCFGRTAAEALQAAEALEEFARSVVEKIVPPANMPPGNISASANFERKSILPPGVCPAPENVLVRFSTGAFTFAASQAGKKVKPLLDDMAQMIGTSLKCFADDARSIPLKMNGAVLIKGRGALLGAVNEYELHSLELVVEKSCLAHVVSKHLGKVHPISFIESLLMRFIYVSKYSKGASADKRKNNV